MNAKFKIMFVAVATVALSVPIAVLAAPKTSPSPSPSAHASPATKPTTSPAPKTTASPADKTTTARAIPFHGKISAVDQTAKTFTIAGKEKSRVFKVTDKTVITKAGAAATMKDVVANEEVRGSYWKAADGSLETKTLKVGSATVETKTTKKKSTAVEPSPSASPKP
jgi:hypothetical protein